MTDVTAGAARVKKSTCLTGVLQHDQDLFGFFRSHVALVGGNIGWLASPQLWSRLKYPKTIRYIPMKICICGFQRMNTEIKSL